MKVYTKGACMTVEEGNQRKNDYVERSNVGTKLRHPQLRSTFPQSYVPSETELNYLINLAIQTLLKY